MVYTDMAKFFTFREDSMVSGLSPLQENILCHKISIHRFCTLSLSLSVLLSLSLSLSQSLSLKLFLFSNIFFIIAKNSIVNKISIFRFFSLQLLGQTKV